MFVLNWCLGLTHLFFLFPSFFPHGTGYVTLSAIATAIISFALNANQFDIAVHIPAMIALVIVLCTTVTTVNSSFLVGGAVVCFVNAFLGAFYVYMMIAYNSCKDESVVFDEKEEYCASRLQDMALEALASLFWTLTGLLVLRIPQPSHAENNEQTAVFNAAPNSIDGFELA